MREGKGGGKGRTNAWFCAGSKLYNLTWLESKTCAIQETQYVTSGRMNPGPPLTGIGLKTP